MGNESDGRMNFNLELDDGEKKPSWNALPPWTSTESTINPLDEYG